MNDKLRSLTKYLSDHKYFFEVVPYLFVDDAIVKTIVFKKKSDGSAFAVVVRKSDRVCYKKLRKLHGKVSALSPKELEQLGWVPGECCPLSINCPLFVDESVFSLPHIHSGSGDVHFGLIYSLDTLRAVRPNLIVLDLRV